MSESSDQKNDYKTTLRLPQTDFPMKGNLPLKEPEMIQRWQEKDLYKKIMKKNKGQTRFVLTDGPPYANGSIHIGHALNKILKDIIVKYKNMKGFWSPFIPGWDCHGLPIEHTILKNLGPKVKEKTNSEIRELCRVEAQKWINHQRPQFQRLGILADWEKPYLTMDPSYEAEQVREFARQYSKGLIYLGTKPVYWNWALQTALADAEVEYHPHKSPAIYVKFNVIDSATLKKIGAPSKPTSLVIWTTTPWTLPANLGVCLNAEFEYGVYDIGSENIIIGKPLKEFFEKDTGVSLNLISSFKGSELEFGKAKHPFINRDSLIVLGSHVAADAGTACVHTAPGHGVDDYKTGLRYNLPILSPVDAAGCYTDEYSEMKGTNILKANPIIIEKLKMRGHLLGYKEIEHSYPHCWRSKTPLIFRATPQWFLGIDIEGKEIRSLALKEMDSIQFYPDWGKSRFHAMMSTRPDWCLSRQRIWGVPIPIFYCVKTEKPLIDEKLMFSVADVMEKEGGIEAFFKYSPDYFISLAYPQKEKAFIESMQNRHGHDLQFGSSGFCHGKDIFDVWFDSGICHAAVQKRRIDEGLSFPADIYLEGSDQHRGWFNTSLITSLATNGQSPFKTLITHGFVNDSKGMKMSKSKGNVVDPNDVAKKNGVEIIRLWSIYEDYGGDVKCGQIEFERVTETYRRVRNTMKFLLGVTFDFDSKKDSVKFEEMLPLDQWALGRLYELTVKVTEAYDSYLFYKVYHLLNNFFTVDLSAIYLDILKDRLYTWKAQGKARRSAQTVVFTITDYLIRMMAPVLSFLAEESYSYVLGEKEESVFLLNFPEALNQWNQPALMERFDELLKVRSDVQKSLESLRAQKIIGSSLDAKVEITASGKVYEILKSFDGSGGLFSNLRELLIVSEVTLKDGFYNITVDKATGEKCARCWVYSSDVGKSNAHPHVCSKCLEALL